MIAPVYLSSPNSRGLRCLFLCLSVLGAVSAWAQTNPTAQTLPYTQDFSGLAHTSASYPAGWQGWQLSTGGASSSFRVTAATANLSLNASSNATTTSGGVHNYNGKIGFLQSGGSDPAIALAINTTGLNGIQVSYDIMTIRNPYDGSTNTRINEATLQYRVGTTGNFTTLTGIEYQNNTTAQTGAVTTPQNPQSKNITLPAACNNNAVVQLRWVARDVSGGGSRASFAVDNISICSTPACSINGPDYVCNNTAGILYTATPGMSSYSWSISSNGSIPGATNGSSVSVTSGNYLSTYTVSVTNVDANGCSSSCSKTSNIFLAKPPADITANPNPICLGATLDLSITAAASSTVSWTGNGIVNPSGNPSTTAVPTTTGAQTYGVTVTTDQGCSNTGTVSVTVNDAPAACSINGPTTACAGSTGNVYTAPAGQSSYSWSIGGNGTITSATNGSSVTVTAGGGGSYTVSVTIGNASGCTATCSQNVPVTAAPACSIIGPPPFPGPSNDTLCAGQQYVFSATPGMSAYQWSVTPNCTINGSATGSSVTVTVNGNLTQNMTVFVTITDANGCISTCSKFRNAQAAPTCSLNGPTSVCGNSTGNVYTAGPLGPQYYYFWSISGDGTITSPTTGSSATSVTVTAGPSGMYTVTLGVKLTYNTCITTCSQGTTIISTPAPVISGPSTVCTGSSAMLDAGAGYGTYAWSNGGGSGQTATFTNINSPTTYTVTVTNGSCSGTATFTVTPQSCTIDFSGKIRWEHDDVTGVKDATVKLTGSATATTLTDINGNYTITTGLTSGSFMLKPTKNLNKFNGVNAGDVSAIQQHVTLASVITDPYKLVCADVNKNNLINTLDASLITQSILGNPSANAQFNTSWRFVPASYALSNPPWGFPEQLSYTGINMAQTNQDFIGMKIGDVTGDANPANFNADPMVLRTQDRVLQAGEAVDVLLRADQLNDLAAVQFGLNFDPAQLHFEAVDSETPGLLTADNVGTYQAAEGEIRALWAQATGIRVEEAAPVLHLHFTALKSGVRLSEVLGLNDDVLPGLAFSGKLAESTVSLIFETATGTTDPADASGLQLQVLPNPFRETTTVSFTLPEPCEAQLRVVDVNGRELLRVRNTYPAGANHETLRLEGLSASGVLTCELITPFGVATRKMVAAK